MAKTFMKTLESHKDLIVWRESMDFAIEIYRATKGFPEHEKYGLIRQMRRAAVSIPSNIAEGSARKNTREMIQFLYISLGSVSEIETQLELSRKLGYLNDDNQLESSLTPIAKMLISLIRSLKNKCDSK